MTTTTPSTIQATDVQQRAMRDTILTQVFSTLGMLAFSNGIMLLFMTTLKFDSARIIMYLALPSLIDCIVRIPAAYIADRTGKKLVGGLGAMLELVGLALIPLAAYTNRPELFSVMGFILYGLGNGLFSSSWFAILDPIVPENQRGRFFGRLRMSWQTSALIFAVISQQFLTNDSPLWTLQLVLAVIVLACVPRIYYYLRLPELEETQPDGHHFLDALRQILYTDRLVPFCAYTFLLMLFTGGVPALFGLIEKNVLQMGDRTVVWMGILFMLGCVVGFFLGGKATDRWGTKPVFLVCHFGYGVLLLVFLTREAWMGLMLLAVAGVNFAFGIVYAASNLAISTEILALIPPENKSLSTSVCNVMHRGGWALSGILSGVALKMGFLSDSWELFGRQMTRYDAILLVFGTMVVLLVVTLGLVPSVVRKPEWVPRQP